MDLRHERWAWLARLWKDTWLYDGTGKARPALSSWRKALAGVRE
jgi:hypothetical protein